ncbi:unnamed protein product [Adineta ricciae]|uniref:Uncharacterized protein n=1 Tax=Adineta ricciae TaxID=249248 RepID=A0A815CMI5_ADIRI|nr:unnamed protein product [Adineta ricciae]CAF1284848.1 unnamed protein product [Adineta ricciae]
MVDMNSDETIQSDNISDPLQHLCFPQYIGSLSTNDYKQLQNVEQIWFDKSLVNRSKSKQLSGMATDMNTFTKHEQCINFINVNRNTKIHLIVSGCDQENLLSSVHDLQQIKFIFILCDDNCRHQQLTSKWPKIIGIYTKVSSLNNALRDAARLYERNSTSISFIMPNSQLNQLDPTFMYTQIFKEILLNIQFERKHIKAFWAYSRRMFCKAPQNLSVVHELQQSYHKKSPIWWYTYDSFLYSMLNHSLRLMDGDMIIRMGFFINDLHHQIDQLHRSQLPVSKFIVYRGQGLSKIDLSTMQQSKGGLISFNSFLSTSKTRRLAVEFAQGAITDPELVGIIFIMRVDPTQSKIPFASVEDVGCFPAENEVLFSMHTIFLVDDINPMDGNDRIHEVNLTLTNSDDNDLNVLTDQIRQETDPQANEWYRLGLLLLRLGQLNRIEKFFETARTRSHPGLIYYQLGRVKDAREEYQKAIRLHKKAIKIFQKNSSIHERHLANAYNELSKTYCSMNLYSKALLFAQRALQIRQKSRVLNHADLAMSYNSIGNIYYTQRIYDQALLSYVKALKIYQQSQVYNHPDLALMHMSIGNSYYSLHSYEEALVSHTEALKIRQKSLPPKHRDIAASYNNIGLVYEAMKDYYNARISYEMAVDIGQQALPPDHQNLRICRKNLEHIKQADHAFI